jgi:hypothetical protein
MKNCTSCKVKLPLNKFNKDKSRGDGLSPKCKSCFKKDNALRYQNKKESIKEHNKNWNQENKEKNKKTWEIYYQNNKKELILKSKTWNQENKERFNKRMRENRNPLFQSVRSRINKALKKYTNEGKEYSTENYLGCSIKEYKLYLEQQFSADMNWENYGVYWEIDHTIPLSKGGSFHYTNTTPMTISENRSKSNKL